MGEELADLYKSRKYRYLSDAKKPTIMSVSGMTDDNIKILMTSLMKTKNIVFLALN